MEEAVGVRHECNRLLYIRCAPAAPRAYRGAKTLLDGPERVRIVLFLEPSDRLLAGAAAPLDRVRVQQVGGLLVSQLHSTCAAMEREAGSVRARGVRRIGW